MTSLIVFAYDREKLIDQILTEITDEEVSKFAKEHGYVLYPKGTREYETIKRWSADEKLTNIINKNYYSSWSVRQAIENFKKFLKERNIPYLLNEFKNVGDVKFAKEAVKDRFENSGKGRPGVVSFIIPDYEEDPPEPESNINYILYALVPLIALLVLRR
jgi:hypothetical protein